MHITHQVEIWVRMKMLCPTPTPTHPPNTHLQANQPSENEQRRGPDGNPGCNVTVVIARKHGTKAKQGVRGER